MKRILPPNMFIPYRCIAIPDKCPSEDAVNQLFDFVLEDLATSDQMIEENKKFDIKERWDFIQKKIKIYNQQPKPECFVKYITMDNCKFLNIDSLTCLHFMLQQGSISWVEEFVLTHKGHLLLINKLFECNDKKEFINLHKDEKNLEFFKLIFQCIRDIQNIKPCQKELMNEQKLLPTLFEALSIQNDDIFRYILESLMPFILCNAYSDEIYIYLDKYNFYSILKSKMVNGQNLLNIKNIVIFTNSLFLHFDKIESKIGFILKLQKESILSQLKSFEISESEYAYSLRQGFLNNISDILLPLKQILPQSVDLNLFDVKDIHDHILEHIGKKIISNVDLSLIEIEYKQKQEFENVYTFLHNFLVLYRHFRSQNINISINEIANFAAKKKILYNPAKGVTFTEDFYECLYKETSFVPSIMLENIDIPNISSPEKMQQNDENNETLKDLKEKNQKLANECKEKDLMIQELQKSLRLLQSQSTIAKNKDFEMVQNIQNTETNNSTKEEDGEMTFAQIKSNDNHDENSVTGQND